MESSAANDCVKLPGHTYLASLQHLGGYHLDGFVLIHVIPSIFIHMGLLSLPLLCH